MNCNISVVAGNGSIFYLNLTWESNGTELVSTSNISITRQVSGSLYSITMVFGPLLSVNTGQYHCQVTFSQSGPTIYDSEADLNITVLSGSDCPKCGRDMHLVKRKAVNKEQMEWRCPRKDCRQEVTLRSGTFFEGTLRWLNVHA